jgi:hypothetical protein
MKLHLLSRLFVIIGVILMGIATGRSAAGLEGREGCTVQAIRVDERQSGPVERTVFVEVTNGSAMAGITVKCERRVAGPPNWSIRIGKSTPAFGNVDRKTIAGAILLAVEILRRDYTNDSVGEIYLEPEGMPAEFASVFYEAVAARMRKLDSKPTGFYDQRVKDFVKKAYQETEYVGYIKTQLERDGFRVTVEATELCRLKRSMEGKQWREIAETDAAGLEVASAICCMILDRVGNADVRRRRNER